MISDFTELATEKTPRGARQRLCENQVIQSQRAQAEARLGSARAFLLSGLAEIWEAVGEIGELRLEQNTKIRLASAWAIDQAEVVDSLYHSAGATAIFDDRPFERRFRDMHTASQQAQARQAHDETIGRILFGLALDTAMFAFSPSRIHAIIAWVVLPCRQKHPYGRHLVRQPQKGETTAIAVREVSGKESL